MGHVATCEADLEFSSYVLLFRGPQRLTRKTQLRKTVILTIMVYYISIDNKIKYKQNVSTVYLQYFEWAQGISGIKGSLGSCHLNILGDHY